MKNRKTEERGERGDFSPTKMWLLYIKVVGLTLPVETHVDPLYFTIQFSQTSIRDF
jgi:hypothetical protein